MRYDINYLYTQSEITKNPYYRFRLWFLYNDKVTNIGYIIFASIFTIIAATFSLLGEYHIINPFIAYPIAISCFPILFILSILLMRFSCSLPKKLEHMSDVYQQKQRKTRQ